MKNISKAYRMIKEIENKLAVTTKMAINVLGIKKT